MRGRESRPQRDWDPTSAGLRIQEVRAVSVSTKDVALTSCIALFSSRYDATWRTAGICTDDG